MLSLILSCLDFCDSLLAGLSSDELSRVQRLQNHLTSPQSYALFGRSGDVRDADDENRRQRALSSACWRRAGVSRAVHCLIFSVQLFLGLPLLLPSRVPCRMIFARVFVACDVTEPHHLPPLDSGE